MLTDWHKKCSISRCRQLMNFGQGEDTRETGKSFPVAHPNPLDHQKTPEFGDSRARPNGARRLLLLKI